MNRIILSVFKNAFIYQMESNNSIIIFEGLKELPTTLCWVEILKRDFCKLRIRPPYPRSQISRRPLQPSSSAVMNPCI